MPNTPLPVATPGSYAGEIPACLAPDPATIFAARARRFDQLADGHALGDWLRFLARLSDAQHAALRDMPGMALPSRQALARARDYAMPPLPAAHLARDPRWRAVLASILTSVRNHAPAPGRDAIDALRVLPPDALEKIADRVLRLESGADVAAQPFVAAALQVYWTHLAAALGSDALHKLDIPALCPCCGGPPVASVVKNHGDLANLRYLHCALCNTEWHLARVHCAACNHDKGVAYRSLEGSNQSARAETCDECHGYLKIFHPDKDPLLDPVADDLATLALDLLVDEAGYHRSGPNLLLVNAG